MVYRDGRRMGDRQIIAQIGGWIHTYLVDGRHLTSVAFMHTTDG